MSIHKSLFSSDSEEWPTPPDFFAKLDAEFAFTLDPCATDQSAKCETYFTKADDGLAQDWGKHQVFCNPPYGRAIGQWIRKCYEASQNGAIVVLLIPSRTDTRYFHDFIHGKAELRFVRGRLKFGEGRGSAPFPSLVAIYRPPTVH